MLWILYCICPVCRIKLYCKIVKAMVKFPNTYQCTVIIMFIITFSDTYICEISFSFCLKLLFMFHVVQVNIQLKLLNLLLPNAFVLFLALEAILLITGLYARLVFFQCWVSYSISSPFFKARNSNLLIITVTQNYPLQLYFLISLEQFMI